MDISESQPQNAERKRWYSSGRLGRDEEIQSQGWGGLRGVKGTEPGLVGTQFQSLGFLVQLFPSLVEQSIFWDPIIVSARMLGLHLIWSDWFYLSRIPAQVISYGNSI